METVGHRGGETHSSRFFARGRTFAFTMFSDLIWRCGVARGDIRDEELIDRLSWFLIVPLGIVQVIAALWAKRQIGKSLLGATIFATLASLAAGIAVAASQDEWIVRPATLTLFLGPGVPTFIALARRRLWAPALFMFLFLPALLAILPR